MARLLVRRSGRASPSARTRRPRILGVSRDYFDEHVIGELRSCAGAADPRSARRRWSAGSSECDSRYCRSQRLMAEGHRGPPLPLLRLVSRQALHLRARLSRRRLRRDRPAEGLEDVQDARRSPPLARHRPDAGREGRASIWHRADAPGGRRGFGRGNRERRDPDEERRAVQALGRARVRAVVGDSTSSPRSAARSSRRSSGATSSASQTSCSRPAPIRARSGTRSNRSR